MRLSTASLTFTGIPPGGTRFWQKESATSVACVCNPHGPQCPPPRPARRIPLRSRREVRMQSLKDLVAEVPDFPKPGILFRDISPLLRLRFREHDVGGRRAVLRAGVERDRRRRRHRVARVHPRVGAGGPSRQGLRADPQERQAAAARSSTSPTTSNTARACSRCRRGRAGCCCSTTCSPPAARSLASSALSRQAGFAIQQRRRADRPRLRARLPLRGPRSPRRSSTTADDSHEPRRCPASDRARRRWPSSSSRSCSTCSRSAAVIPVLPRADRGVPRRRHRARRRGQRPVRHGLGADAVLLDAGDGRAVRSLRSPTRDPAVEPRARRSTTC